MHGRMNFNGGIRLAAVIFTLFGTAWGAEQGPVLDRAVAVMNQRLITLSELEFEVSIALVEHGAVDAAIRPLDEETLRTGLDYAIGQYLQAEEAEKLHAFPIESTELLHEEDQFRAKFPSKAAFERFLARFDMDTRQLDAVLERKLRAEKFLESKLRLRAQVSEAELKRYYAEHLGELGPSFDAVRDSLTVKLKRERYEALAKAELDQLRRAADVRIVVGQSMREATP